MQKAVPNSVKSTLKPRTESWKREAIHGSSRMIGVGEVVTNFRIDKTGLAERCVRPLTVGANVERLARWVMQVGGKFLFPVRHTLLSTFSIDALLPWAEPPPQYY